MNRKEQEDLLKLDQRPKPFYGMGRHEVGGRRLGRGDGSVGAWAAQFVRIEHITGKDEE